MRVRRSRLLLLSLLLIAAGAFWGLKLLTGVSLSPEKGSELPRAVYLGRAVFFLPENFKVEAGRLQMICEGSAELTTVVEVPYPESGTDLYSRLSLLVPEGRRHFLMKDLSGDFKRSAHLIFTDPAAAAALASVIMDFGQGSIRLSRPVKYDPKAEAYDSLAFEKDARGFSENYLWGHNGRNPSDLHSLQGRVGPEQGCRDYQANIRFVSDKDSIKLVMVNDRNKDLAAVAAENSLELAFDGRLNQTPGRFSELARLKQGIWNRKIRGGRRTVAGQPGFEWLVLRHDLSTGRKYFAALWRPETQQAQAIPALMMSAEQADAAKALYYWNDLVGKSKRIGAGRTGNSAPASLVY